MGNILVEFFAAVDCKVVNDSEVRAIAEAISEKIVSPREWIMHLRVSDSSEESIRLIREAMKDLGVMLPDDIGDLMVGLILLRYEEEGLPAEATRLELFDVVDAYGSTCIDLASVWELKPSNAGCDEVICAAKKVLHRLRTSQIDENDIYYLQG